MKRTLPTHLAIQTTKWSTRMLHGNFLDGGRLLNQFGKVTIAADATIQGNSHFPCCKDVVR